MRNRIGRTAAICVAVFAGAAGVAFATGLGNAPAQSAINGCMQKNNGQLRIADSCRPDEQAITWNIAGAKGDPGPAGAAGPQGPTGERGPAGPQGPAGKDGMNGVDGTNGVDGKDGVNGKDGVSVTSTPLAVGDTNCPTGGSAFTAAGGTTTYACNGKDGQNAGSTSSATTIAVTGLSLRAVGQAPPVYDLTGIGTFSLVHGNFGCELHFKNETSDTWLIPGSYVPAGSTAYIWTVTQDGIIPTQTFAAADPGDGRLFWMSGVTYVRSGDCFVNLRLEHT